MTKNLFALIASITFSTAACAQVSVSSPWIRATVPQQTASGAFMGLVSAKDARLVEARSPVARLVQIHKMEMQGDMMKMAEVDGIDLPAGKPVSLASGGYHIMLIDLKRQLKAGDSVAMTLVVEGKNKQRETIKLDVPVKPLNHVGAPSGAAMHH
jgi:copper(I)-binding protein